MSSNEISEAIKKNNKDIQAAVKILDLIEADRLRDENKEIEKLLNQK